MTDVKELITDNIDVWTSAIKKKSATGRGSSKKIELRGIKKLRELILELAVRGKLVPQDASDEPASVLLERIAKEKAQLIADKKIKKQKPIPEVTDEEKPFELPEGWENCRLGNMGNIFNGNSVNARLKEERYTNLKSGLPFIATKDVDYGYKPLDYKNGVLIPANEPKFKIAHRGAVLVCAEGGSAGKKCGIADQDICFGNKLFANELFAGLNSKFVLFIYLSPTFFCQFSESMTGIIGGISANKFNELIVSLPPLVEQHRIVAKVDELMALCDQLEQQTDQSLSAHQTLVEELLKALVEDASGTTTKDGGSVEKAGAIFDRIADHFDVLFTTEQSIEQLRQTILQLAVMGKLVPQNPNDEPASVLVDKLSTEQSNWLESNFNDNAECKTMLRKLKKLKSPKPPFLLPKSWACVHLIQTTQLLVDCHNKTAPYTDSGIPIIRTTNIREREFRFDGLKYVNEDTYNYWSRRCPPESGDIMFTREAPMGEAAIIPKGVKWCLGQRTMLIRPIHEYISNKFLLLALTEPHLLERASEHAVGLTVKHLRVGDVENLNIPLPPLAEQHRIVAKVDELMALCEQLKALLSDAQTTQLHLADAVVANALN